MIPLVSRKCESPHAAAKRRFKAGTLILPSLVNVSLKRAELLALCDNEEFLCFAESRWLQKCLVLKLLDFVLGAEDKVACIRSHQHTCSVSMPMTRIVACRY